MTTSIDPPTPQPPMRRWIFLGSIITLVLILVMTAAVVTRTAIAQQIGGDGLLALMVFGGVALTASLATTEVIPWGTRSIEHWLQPRVLSAVAMAIILATGTLFSLLPLLQSTRDQEAARKARDETATKLNDIAEDVSVGRAKIDSLNQKLGVGEPSFIIKRIGGVWGEAGTDTDAPCGVMYRFNLEDAALTIDKFSSSARTSISKYVYTRNGDNDIISPSGGRQSRLITEATTQALVEEGIAAHFTLESNGQHRLDRMTWEHRGGSIMPIKLVRCDGSGVKP